MKSKKLSVKSSVLGLGLGLGFGMALSSSLFAVEITPNELPKPVEEQGLKVAPEVKKNLWIGLQLEPLSGLLKKQLKLESGVAVMNVSPDGPAAKSGIAVNDIITSVAGTAVSSVTEIRDILSDHQADDLVELTYMREGEAYKSAVGLEERAVRPRNIAPQQRIQLGAQDLLKKNDLNEQIQQAMKEAGLLDQLGALNIPQGNNAGNDHQGLDRNQLLKQITSSKTMMYSDGNHSYKVTSNDGNNQLRVENTKENVLLYDGPMNTEAEKANIPAKHLKKAEEMLGGVTFKIR
ncbi:PDZ domain-containing protein [Akkermansiaceae bacterium]|nr:PDZ domain-containing protein [Akkermansiaceae bacterium]